MYVNMCMYVFVCNKIRPPKYHFPNWYLYPLLNLLTCLRSWPSGIPAFQNQNPDFFNFSPYQEAGTERSWNLHKNHHHDPCVFLGLNWIFRIPQQTFGVPFIHSTSPSLCRGRHTVGDWDTAVDCADKQTCSLCFPQWLLYSVATLLKWNSRKLSLTLQGQKTLSLHRFLERISASAVSTSSFINYSSSHCSSVSLSHHWNVSG